MKSGVWREAKAVRMARRRGWSPKKWADAGTATALAAMRPARSAPVKWKPAMARVWWQPVQLCSRRRMRKAAGVVMVVKGSPVRALRSMAASIEPSSG